MWQERRIVLAHSQSKRLLSFDFKLMPLGKVDAEDGTQKSEAECQEPIKQNTLNEHFQVVPQRRQNDEWVGGSFQPRDFWQNVDETVTQNGVKGVEPT